MSPNETNQTILQVTGCVASSLTGLVLFAGILEQAPWPTVVFLAVFFGGVAAAAFYCARL